MPPKRPLPIAPARCPASPGAPSARRRWSRLAAGVLAILLFAFVAIPSLQRVSAVREVREGIQRAGIDATALFYTESEAASEAEASIRDAMRY